MTQGNRPGLSSVVRMFEMIRTYLVTEERIVQLDRAVLRSKVRELGVTFPNLFLSPAEVEHVLDRLEAEFLVRAGPMRVIEEHGADAGVLWQPVPGSLSADLRRMLERRRWTAGMLASLEEDTLGILSRLVDPADPQARQRLGLVVGQVQSGKTTSYTALVAGALESGYRAVVVLAGRTDELRNQTQKRLDEGIVGLRALAVRGRPVDRLRVGVGLLREELGLSEWPLDCPLQQLTTAQGDFGLRWAMANNLLVGSATNPPVLFAVVKKHRAVLNNLRSWLVSRLHNGPLLVIDDEADDASIDIAAGEDPSETNKAIRALLQCSERSAYVGYTATPYANLLINPDTLHGSLGIDLFPRDFVVVLDTPETYMGPAEFLNPKGQRRHYVTFRDADGWIGTAQVGPMPVSLKEALCEFVLATAIRTVRSQRLDEPRGHASMLVHCNVRVGIHRLITSQIQRFLEDLVNGWGFDLEGEVPRLLQKVFQNLDKVQDQAVHVSWEELSSSGEDEPFGVIGSALGRMRVLMLNSGRGQDGLRYEDAEQTVIAVGGHMLSRGLTLEGLTTSYQSRSMDLQDSLLQMGRWFGYRPGYADLCRVHTTGSLLDSFRNLLDADLELRQDLLDLAAGGGTPFDAALSVVQGDDLRVTSAAKRRSALLVRGLKGGRTLEITWFPRAQARFNEVHAGYRLQQLGSPDDAEPGRYIWDNVGVDWVLDTLEGHQEPQRPGGRSSPAERAMVAVRRAADEGLMTSWRVVVLNAQRDDPERDTVELAGLQLRRFQRVAVGHDDLRLKVVSQPADERFAVGAITDPGNRREVMKAGRNLDVGLLLGYPLLVNVEGEEEQPPVPTFAWAVSMVAHPDDKDRLLGVRAQQEYGLRGEP